MTHTLELKDSLDLLAYEVYGSVSNFRDIASANGLNIFEPLPVGRAIALPVSVETVPTTTDAIKKALDLSGLKQPESDSAFKLISWIF